jgi:hypothetical protein
VGWLRTVAIVVVALSVAAGVIGALTVATRASGLNSARHVSEPLVVDAQKLVVDLTEANTTIAGGFLDGAVVPEPIQSSYATYLTEAANALAATSEGAGKSSKVSSFERTVLSGLPLYEATVATAEADNRQGIPLAAAYLTEANHFMSAVLLPAAYGLYTTEESRLSADDRRSTSGLGEIAVIVLLVLVVAALIYMQVGLSGRFRRIFSPAAILATISVVVLMAWTALALASEGSAVSHAERVGSAPLGQLTQERIQEGRVVADDQDTKATYDALVTYVGGKATHTIQNELSAVEQELNPLMSHPVRGWTAAESNSQAAAARDWTAYAAASKEFNNDENAGAYSLATADTKRAAPAASQLDASLAGGVSLAEAEFGRSATAAASDVDGLLLGGILLLGVAVAASLAALWPRMREYR